MYSKEEDILRNLFHYGFDSAAKTLSEMFNKHIHISIDSCNTTNEICKIDDENPLKHSSYYKNNFVDIYFLLHNDDYLKLIYALDSEKMFEYNEIYYFKRYYYEIANIITGNLTYALFSFFNIDFVSETPLALKNHVNINLCKNRHIDLEVSFEINNNILKSQVNVCLDKFYWNEIKNLMEGLNYEP